MSSSYQPGLVSDQDPQVPVGHWLPPQPLHPPTANQVPAQPVPQPEEKLSVADDGGYKLIIRQEPAHARVAIGKDKDRKPIDPPPIVQLKVSSAVDPIGAYLQSPYLLMTCHLIADSDDKANPTPSSLSGSLVSSIHKLKDADNTDGGFFIWGDLSAKVEGQYRLQFTLFELKFPEMVYITYVVSRPFIVHPPKTFPGMSESTFLTRSFSDQGVRLRLRKDSRSMTNRKRNAAAAVEHTGQMRMRAHQEEEQRRRSQMRQNSYSDSQMSPIDNHRPSLGGPGALMYDSGMGQRRDMGYHTNPYGNPDPVVKRQRTGMGDDSPAQWATDMPQYPTPTSVDDGSSRRQDSGHGAWTPTMPYTTSSPVFSLPATSPGMGGHGGHPGSAMPQMPTHSPSIAQHHQQHPLSMPTASPGLSHPPQGNGIMATAPHYNSYGQMVATGPPQAPPPPYAQDQRRIPGPGEIPPNFNF